MKPADEDDWRISGQNRFLEKAVLEWRQYSPPSAQWDHDHCEFCWSKLSLSGSPESLLEGYATEDGKHWICKNLFR